MLAPFDPLVSWIGKNHANNTKLIDPTFCLEHNQSIKASALKILLEKTFILKSYLTTIRLYSKIKHYIFDSIEKW
jgi:hypothetical protein